MTLLTWNLGYAGLDRYMDFFMGGSRMSHPRSKSAVQENFEAIKGFLLNHYADIYFLQEVDRNSARTCRSNEKPYKAGENFTTTIDGFLTSPNLEVRQVIGHPKGFPSVTIWSLNIAIIILFHWLCRQKPLKWRIAPAGK